MNNNLRIIVFYKTKLNEHFVIRDIIKISVLRPVVIRIEKNGVTVRTKRIFFVKLVLSLMTLISGQIIFGTRVFGITNSSITINLGGMAPLNLMPGEFGSTSQSISVTTDNYTGITTKLENTVNDTALINTTNSSLTIPTITLPSGSSSITASQFTSGYGVSTDGINYVPAPTASNSILLGVSNVASSSSYVLTFAAKPATDAAIGTYNRTFIVTAVANSPQYSITYDANAGTDIVTGMPNNQSTTISNTGTVTLPNNEPARADYTFLGWDTDSTATSPTYPTGSANTIILEPTQANALTLYAIWEQSGSTPGTYEEVHPDGSKTRTTIDADGNKFIQEISATDEVVAYYIDTTATGGYTITSGNSLDTELVAFDSSSTFTLHIFFKTTLSQNNGKYILTALDQNGTSYNGFSLYVYNNNYLRTGIYKNRTRSTSTGLVTPNSYIGLNTSSMSGERAFDVTITYDPKGSSNKYAKITASLVGGTSGSQSNTSSSTNVPTNLPNATITLGGNGIDGLDDVNSITIIEFQVEKSTST